jgi:signal transduction histidine kinase
VRITASASQTHLRVQVDDTGIGIKPEDFSKLFVEFQQVDSGRTRRYGGTGLGLALTKRLIEFQRGTIEVSSEPDRGSSFVFSLPIRETPPAADTHRA